MYLFTKFEYWDEKKNICIELKIKMFFPGSPMFSAQNLQAGLNLQTATVCTVYIVYRVYSTQTVHWIQTGGSQLYRQHIWSLTAIQIFGAGKIWWNKGGREHFITLNKGGGENFIHVLERKISLERGGKYFPPRWCRIFPTDVCFISLFALKLDEGRQSEVILDVGICLAFIHSHFTS